MKYCTNDGKKIFDTKEEVLEYEAKIEEEKKAKEQELKIKEDKIASLQKAYNALNDSIQEFEKIYGETIPGIPRYLRTSSGNNPVMSGLSFPKYLDEFWERLFNI